VGYPEWERSRDGRDRRGPETGRWDVRQERWIPQQRGPEGDDYGIEPFPARSDPQRRPGQGRVLDHDDWSAGNRRRFEQPPGKGSEVDEDEDDEEELDQRTVYIGSFVSTALWYLIPAGAYAGYSFTLSNQPRPGCTNAFGLPCPGPRAEALGHLTHEVPQIALAMAISIVMAMILGKVTTGWRPFAIGFASAVLGAGVATVVFAVVATQL
jgi:hypothetical protein